VSKNSSASYASVAASGVIAASTPIGGGLSGLAAQWSDNVKASPKLYAPTQFMPAATSGLAYYGDKSGAQWGTSYTTPISPLAHTSAKERATTPNERLSPPQGNVGSKSPVDTPVDGSDDVYYPDWSFVTDLWMMARVKQAGTRPPERKRQLCAVSSLVSMWCSFTCCCSSAG